MGQERIDRIGVGEMDRRRRQGRCAGEPISQDIFDADAAARAERRKEQKIARIPAMPGTEIGEHRTGAGQMRRDGSDRLLLPADLGIAGGDASYFGHIEGAGFGAGQIDGGDGIAVRVRPLEAAAEQAALGQFWKGFWRDDAGAGILGHFERASVQVFIVHIKQAGFGQFPRGGQILCAGELRYGRIEADHGNSGAHRRQSDKGMIDAAGRQSCHRVSRAKAPFGELGGDGLGARQAVRIGQRVPAIGGSTVGLGDYNLVGGFGGPFAEPDIGVRDRRRRGIGRAHDQRAVIQPLDVNGGAFQLVFVIGR